MGEGFCQTKVIERRSARIVLGIDENEFRTAERRLAIPEAVGFLDPMRTYVRQLNDMTQIARKKLLRSLVVLERALGA